MAQLYTACFGSTMTNHAKCPACPKRPLSKSAQRCVYKFNNLETASTTSSESLGISEPFWGITPFHTQRTTYTKRQVSQCSKGY